MLLDIINQYSNIITSHKVLEYDISGPNIKLKYELTFKDNSTFSARQIIINNKELKYSYHWQNSDNLLICRWDNAPHYPDISTFPHHKHIVLENTEIITESYGGDIGDILKEIETRFNSDAGT